MITIHRADDVFSVDTEQTQRYDAAHSLCDCGYCRNYYAQIKGKLPKLDAFLNEKSSVRLHRAFNHQIARVTLPERRHRVQTYTWRGVPLITALTRLTLGFQGRLERRWE